MLLAINNNYNQQQTAWVIIDNELHKERGALKCISSTDAAQISQSMSVETWNRKAVLIYIPAAGFVIFE